MNTPLIHTLSFIAFMLLASSGVNAQSRVNITPAYPERGQTVTITYDPRIAGSGIPADAAAVMLVFSYSNLYDVPYRIPMRKENGLWTTSFTLASYATFAAFHLQYGDSLDKPAANKLYELAVYKNKVPVRDGYLYKGYSLSAQMGRSPELGVQQAAMFEKELAQYPDNYEAQVRLLNYKISKASGKEQEALRAKAQKVIADKFYSAPTTDGNVNKVTMGYLIIGENSRVDSIRKVIMDRYPDSNIGRELRTGIISKENDTAAQITLFEKELRKETAKNSSSFDGIHEKLFAYYTVRKDSAKALYHARKVALTSDSPWRPETLKDIAQTLLDNHFLLDTALSYIKQSQDLIPHWPAGVIRYFPETGYIYPYVDDSTRKATQNKAAANLFSMQGLIAMQKGQQANATQYMQQAIALSLDKETVDNATRFYKAAGLTEPLQQLQTLREQQMLAKVKAQRINRPAPSLAAFTDLKGQPLDPAVYTNKIVIIDFWATWCVPCMQEMPYIQKLYDQYKNDPSVVFMIVNSAARNTLADAQGWNGNKKYSFPVYFNTDPTVGDKFKFTVIPATYVIDKAGNIQFSNIGFEGPDVEMKLRQQIELVKGQ